MNFTVLQFCKFLQIFLHTVHCTVTLSYLLLNQQTPILRHNYVLAHFEEKNIWKVLQIAKITELHLTEHLNNISKIVLKITTI